MRSNVVGFYLVAMLVEFFLWSMPPIVFLFVYVGFFSAPFNGVVIPHFIIVLALWLGSVGLRVFSWRITAKLSVWLQKIAAMIIFVVPSLLLLCWYGVALLGMTSWGRITTWPVFKSYLFQVGYLSDVLGVSLWFFAIAILVLVVVFYSVYRLIYKVDFTVSLFGRVSKPALYSISVLGMLSAVSIFFYLPGQAYHYPLEPIGLSFFPGSSALQSHALTVSPLIEADEDSALLSYKKTLNFKRRNVVLIVGDALRADHMGVYGYGRNTTPYLDASLSKYQTLSVSNVRSVCAESSCGLMALASSRPLHLLPSKPITLQSVLRQNGYSVSLVLSGDHTNFYGLKKAYGAVDDYFDGTQQSARYVNDDALLIDHIATLPKYDGRQPVMLQFHLMSTHGLGLKQKRQGDFEPAVNYYSWPSGKGRRAPSMDEVPKAINYYDNGVAQFDLIANEILRVLESKGYLNDAVVVFTGDHGEMLGEKGLFGHQYGVSEEVLRIPFILQRRGYTAEEFGGWSMASQIDIAPTILKELDIVPPSVWRGVPLQSQAQSRLIQFQQVPQVGVYIADNSESLLKYWKDLVTGDEYVFDISKDPSEVINIAGQIDRKKIAVWRSVAVGSAISGVSSLVDDESR